MPGPIKEKKADDGRRDTDAGFFGKKVYRGKRERRAPCGKEVGQAGLATGCIPGGPIPNMSCLWLLNVTSPLWEEAPQAHALLDQSWKTSIPDL